MMAEDRVRLGTARVRFAKTTGGAAREPRAAVPGVRPVMDDLCGRLKPENRFFGGAEGSAIVGTTLTRVAEACSRVWGAGKLSSSPDITERARLSASSEGWTTAPLPVLKRAAELEPTAGVTTGKLAAL